MSFGGPFPVPSLSVQDPALAAPAIPAQASDSPNPSLTVWRIALGVMIGNLLAALVLSLLYGLLSGSLFTH